MPATSARGSVLFAHCFTCSKDLHISTRLARSVSAAGYAVLRFDFTGIGESGGDFADKTVTNNVKDLVAAAHALIRRGYGPCAMVGHSLGGAATLLAARQVKTVGSVAVIGAPASPDHIERLIADARHDIRRHATATVVIGGRAVPISPAFLDELVERAPRIGTVGDRPRRLPVVADLPGLSHHAFWGVPLAEQLGDQTVPEVIIAYVVTQLDRVGIHGPSPYPLAYEQGYSTFVGSLGRKFGPKGGGPR